MSNNFKLILLLLNCCFLISCFFKPYLKEDNDQNQYIKEEKLDMELKRNEVDVSMKVIIKEDENFDIDQAIKDYTKKIKLEPNNYIHYVSRGSLYKAKKYYDKAIDDFIKVTKIESNDSASYYAIAELYSLKNEKEEAFFYLEKSLELKRENESWYISEKDPDFFNIKADKRFKKIINGLLKKGSYSTDEETHERLQKESGNN